MSRLQVETRHSIPQNGNLTVPFVCTLNEPLCSQGLSGISYDNVRVMILNDGTDTFASISLPSAWRDAIFD